MNVTTYYTGDMVKVNIVTTIELHGGLFYKGVFLDGHKKGEDVLISVKHFNDYNMIKGV